MRVHHHPILGIVEIRLQARFVSSLEIAVVAVGRSCSAVTGPLILGVLALRSATKPTLHGDSGISGQCFARCVVCLVRARRAEISLQSLSGGSSVAHAGLVVCGKLTKSRRPEGHPHRSGMIRLDVPLACGMPMKGCHPAALHSTVIGLDAPSLSPMAAATLRPV